MFKHILVPIDGSELSAAAVQRACTFAREGGARLTFYHAKPAYFPPIVAGDIVFDDMAIFEAYHNQTERQSAALLTSAHQVATAAGVDCETLSTECESAYEGIIAAATSQACDLIFMASHGHRGMRALLLGSETQKVLTHCKIPVLVYR